MNIPTFLTLVRILLIPVIVGVQYLEPRWACFLGSLFFVIASLTDWFDGYLARRLNQTTRFGAFLDPVADKVMVAVALALLIEKFNTSLVTLPALVIIGREIVISALREWMAEMGKRTSVAVSFIGKVKTFAQMCSITLLLFAQQLGQGIIGPLGIVLLVVAAILTIWSMLVYIKVSWSYLN